MHKKNQKYVGAQTHAQTQVDKNNKIYTVILTIIIIIMVNPKFWLLFDLPIFLKLLRLGWVL